MEGLLTNNIFFVYLLGILVIINYEAFEKRQKIAIIYACSFGLTFNGDLRCILIILLLLFILFLYEEYLNEDLVKIKYVTRIKYKILDFLYMYIIQYKLLYAIVAILIKSNVCRDFVSRLLKKSEILQISIENILIAIAVLLLIICVHKMFNNPIELKNFQQINQKFSEYPYYLLPLKNEVTREELFEKLELVADIEDYTFFRREKSYSCFSLEFIRIIISKKKSIRNEVKVDKVIWIRCISARIKSLFTWRNIVLFLKKRHKISVFTKYVRKVGIRIKYFIAYRLDCVRRKAKRYIRGYSTIEMQLIRILAFKKGLKMGKPRTWQDMYLIIVRKMYEIIYAPIFFYGHKKYLGVTVERDFYRYYLVYIYLHTVQTNLNGRVYAPLDRIFGNVDVVEWPKEALFVIVLGLNNMRITRDRVDVYMSIINRYQLNIELIYQLVDCIKLHIPLQR